jgi:hypothetical protein
MRTARTQPHAARPKRLLRPQLAALPAATRATDIVTLVRATRSSVGAAHANATQTGASWAELSVSVGCKAAASLALREHI